MYIKYVGEMKIIYIFCNRFIQDNRCQILCNLIKFIENITQEILVCFYWPHCTTLYHIVSYQENMIVWQHQCYLFHTHMLHEDMTSDYRKIGQDMTYVKNFFTNRVVNIWNFLPDYVVHADTVNCFKSRLDTFWSNQDLVYNFKAEISGTGSRSEVV